MLLKQLLPSFTKAHKALSKDLDHVHIQHFCEVWHTDMHVAQDFIHPRLYSGSIQTVSQLVPWTRIPSGDQIHVQKTPRLRNRRQDRELCEQGGKYFASEFAP